MTPSWRVVCSQKILEEIKSLAEIAKKRGQLPEFRTWLQEAQRRLSTDPVDWGDPLYSLPSLSLKMFRGQVGNLNVHYGVHEANRFAVIKSIAFLKIDPPM